MRESSGKRFQLKAVIPTEAAVLDAVRVALQYHPKVKAVWRVNSGATIIGEGKQRRMVRYHDIGVPYMRNGRVRIGGCSDLIGILQDGRFLAIEVKRPGQKPTEEQIGFLNLVLQSGGVAGWVTSADEINEVLK